MARSKSTLTELQKLAKMLDSFDLRGDDDDDLLPSANGIDRIVFQARFIIRALKQDPVALAAIIEATRKSMIANLRSRPELAENPTVADVLANSA
jgi:hypothetical protein